MIKMWIIIKGRIQKKSIEKVQRYPLKNIKKRMIK